MDNKRREMDIKRDGRWIIKRRETDNDMDITRRKMDNTRRGRWITRGGDGMEKLPKISSKVDEAVILNYPILKFSDTRDTIEVQQHWKTVVVESI
jgi:hypothetical protein